MTELNIVPKEMLAKVLELHKLAELIYNESRDFPAINRNTKRILASVHMLTINLEDSQT